MKIDDLFGLPAHPLFVHIPIVMIPLAALGMLIMAFVPQTRARLGWPVVILAGLATFFAWMAKGSGEELERRVEADPLLAHHTALGDTMYLVALVFFVFVTAFVIVDRRSAASAAEGDQAVPATGRRTAGGPVLVALTVVAVLAGGAATARIVQVGHAGSRVTWGDVGAPRSTKKDDD
jgi:uncharacterized membrane protein